MKTAPGNTVTIKLEGPGKNALGTKHMARLRVELAQAGGRPVLLTGAGDCFCAGLDLKEVLRLAPPAMATFLDGLEALVMDIFHYPGPVVAAVNGHAIAGGAVVALACDHSVATTAPGTRIGLNEVSIGLRFPPATLQVLRFRLPPHRHAQVLLGAQLHSPANALTLGLVDELADDCEETARARLALLADRPADAYAATKADLRGGTGRVDAQSRQDFVDQVVPAWTSDRVKTLLSAVLR